LPITVGNQVSSLLPTQYYTMKKLLSVITSLAAAAFVFPLTIQPNAVELCADSTWQFQTVSNTANYEVAAKVARAEYCRVVATNAAMWN